MENPSRPRHGPRSVCRDRGPTSEEAEAILWHDINPHVIRSDVMGDVEVREVYPADDKDELTPLEMLRPPNPEALKTYRVT